MMYKMQMLLRHIKRSNYFNNLMMRVQVFNDALFILKLYGLEHYESH